MKKLLTLIAIASAIIVVSCNDVKDPPDDGFKRMAQARMDSLTKVDSLQKLSSLKN